jgi:hypothetical protein
LPRPFWEERARACRLSQNPELNVLTTTAKHPVGFGSDRDITSAREETSPIGLRIQGESLVSKWDNLGFCGRPFERRFLAGTVFLHNYNMRTSRWVRVGKQRTTYKLHRQGKNIA